MTNTVMLTVGASASGKSTWAKQRAAIYPDNVIACRDDIRRMLGYPPVGTPQQEKQVTLVQQGIIETALLAGKDVIVSDTNLNKQFRKKMIKFCHEHGANVTLTVFDEPLDELHKRTDNRPLEEQVPRDAIKRQYDSLQTQLKDGTLGQREFPVQSYEPYVRPDATSSALRSAIVIDIDGTVANHEGVRSPYDYSKVSMDKPHWDIIEIVQALIAQGHWPIFLSGRDGGCREDTENWIGYHITLGRGYSLFMRAEGDTRPDWIIKNEIWDRDVIPNFNVLCAFDDRDQVVRHLRRRGIRVLQVAYGRF